MPSPTTSSGIFVISVILLCTTLSNVKSSANALAQPAMFPFARHLRAPFSHKGSQMMTARGFGKRNFLDYNDDGWEVSLLDRLMGQEQMHLSEVDAKRSPGEPRLRFRLVDDGNLRIGRGFGKRSVPMDDGQKEEYKNPWSSPSIREWNEAENILRAVLKQVQENHGTNQK
ncbi:uncharacterized protein LOC134827323 [Culicoides brevitarsis]|uniref:uncharacterized protein LOC134827323 n=1 Tax=Culicoides brevitarsis TaxID=469753 RepID=UPI00307BFB5F